MSKPDSADGHRFELLAEIALGQTARIELCRFKPEDGGERFVAVKRLLPHVAADGAFVDMFRDEVWMTSALKHPHVVEVLAWGHDVYGPYLAAELVSGVSLQRLMKTVFETGERFTERMVVYLARCICDGLAEAHSLVSATGEPLDLVHRDLSPGNILLGFRGEVKVADFGLAKARKRLTKTMTGLLKGQPGYMSPEQVAGTEVDARSDIFSLGVILFELFSGRSPFAAASAIEAMRLVSAVDYPALDSLRPNIDRALVELVDRCLKKSPKDRFASAESLRDSLDHWLDVHGYLEKNKYSLARFVRRNSMRQKRWFERATDGRFKEQALAERDAIWPELSVSKSAPVSKRPQSTPAKERIDWGDDGPTLVQRAKPDPAKQKAARAVPRADDSKGSRSKPSSGAGARKRRSLSRSSNQDAKPDSGPASRGTDTNTAPVSPKNAEAAEELLGAEAETERKRRKKVPGALASPPAMANQGSATSSSKGPSGAPLTPALPGILAPHDPNVPPIPPPRPALGTETLVRTTPSVASPKSPVPERGIGACEAEAASDADGTQSVATQLPQGGPASSLPFVDGSLDNGRGVEHHRVVPSARAPDATAQLPETSPVGADRMAASQAGRTPEGSAEETAMWQRSSAVPPEPSGPMPPAPAAAPGPLPIQGTTASREQQPASAQQLNEAAEIALGAAREALRGNRIEAMSRIQEAERLLQRSRSVLGGPGGVPSPRDDPTAWMEHVVTVVWWRSRALWGQLRSGDPFAILLAVILVVLLSALLW